MITSPWQLTKKNVQSGQDAASQVHLWQKCSDSGSLIFPAAQLKYLALHLSDTTLGVSIFLFQQMNFQNFFWEKKIDFGAIFFQNVEPLRRVRHDGCC